MYEAWQQDPKSVHTSWDAYFRNVEAGAGPGQAFQAAPQVSIFPGLLPIQAAAAPVASSRFASNSLYFVEVILKIQCISGLNFQRTYLS